LNVLEASKIDQLQIAKKDTEIFSTSHQQKNEYPNG
jgi:hypothetical protein